MPRRVRVAIKFGAGGVVRRLVRSGAKGVTSRLGGWGPPRCRDG